MIAQTATRIFSGLASTTCGKITFQLLYTRIDPACDQFEAAWQQGTSPRIEEYLADTPTDVREALLRELLHLEIHYESPTLRFSQLSGSPCRADPSNNFVATLLRGTGFPASIQIFSRSGSPACHHLLTAVLIGWPRNRRFH